MLRCCIIVGFLVIIMYFVLFSSIRSFIFLQLSNSLRVPIINSTLDSPRITMSSAYAYNILFPITSVFLLYCVLLITLSRPSRKTTHTPFPLSILNIKPSWCFPPKWRTLQKVFKLQFLINHTSLVRKPKFSNTIHSRLLSILL